MAEFIQFRKFKPDYTDFVFTQIQEFRNTKDTKLMEGINPFDDDNTIMISVKGLIKFIHQGPSALAFYT